MARAVCAFLLLLLLLLLVAISSAKVPRKSPPAAARREDVPYIKCSVCEQIAKQLFLQVERKRSDIAPKQLSEYQLIEVAENICNLKRAEGDWMLYLDIMEEGDKLKLVEQQQEGDCRTECKTIERGCQEVMGYHDTDVAEFLFKGKSGQAALSKFLCKDLSGACSGNIPSIPKDREPGEPFVAKSSKDAEMERIMRSMTDVAGSSNMKMYSKDDLMNGLLNEDEDDDDDEDEDEEMPHKGSREPINGDTNKLLNQVQSIFKVVRRGTQRAISNIHQRVIKASDFFRKWWPEKRDSREKSYSNAEPSNTAEL